MKKILPAEEGDFYLSEEGYRVLQKNIILNAGIVVRAAAGIVLTDIMQRQICSNLIAYLA